MATRKRASNPGVVFTSAHSTSEHHEKRAKTWAFDAALMLSASEMVGLCRDYFKDNNPL
jgi:hypothetical protein